MARTMAEGGAAAFAAGKLETAERLAMHTLNADPNATAEKTARTLLADLSWLQVNRGTDDLGILLAASGDNEELHRADNRLRALAVLEDGRNPETLRRQVKIKVLRGQPVEAALHQRELITLIDETEGATSTSALVARSDLATLLAAAGQHDEGLAVNATVLAAMEAQYGTDDPRLLPVLEQRQEILTAAGRKKQAKKVGKRMKKMGR